MTYNQSTAIYTCGVPAWMSQRNASDSYSSLVYALVLAGLLGYVQPWIVVPSGPMTLNAFDLAEWASLIPAQYGTSPPLVVPLLLRLQPVILSLLLGVIAAGRKRMAITAVAICLLATAQLPPFEFVNDINNLNYRQQFILAATSLVAGFFLLPLASRRVSQLVILVLTVAGIVTAALGLSEAEALYRQFQLEAAPGAGIWILGLSYGITIIISLQQMIIMRGTRS